MNILHLKYAVSIADNGSINKAAEEIHVAQPNLSRVVRELEADLGITIFQRSAHGMSLTPDGEEFIGRARSILAQVDDMEHMYKSSQPAKQRFSISAPRASYISDAFAHFSRSLGKDDAEIFYQEANVLKAVRNILDVGYNLGILRYASRHEKDRADADSQYLCHLILSQLLIHISRVLNQRTKPQEDPGARYSEIMKVHEYINAHYREPLSVSGLAGRFFLDKNTMTRQFKRIIGMTPGDYIRRKRLENARELIRQGCSIQQAGYSSGFTDYSAFFRAFRQYFGVSPGDLAGRSRSSRRKQSGQESGE